MTDQLVPAHAVFPPGDLLAEELAERDWSQTDFAEIIGRPIRLVNEIVAGKRGISPTTAQEIAAALGTSAEFWLGLESSYQLARTAVRSDHIVRRAALRTRYPIREMVRRRWIPSSEHIDDEERCVLAFFGIERIDERPPLLYAARRANADVDLTPKQEAWLCRVRELGASLVTPAFSLERWHQAIGRLLTLRKDVTDIRNVPRVLADAGIRLVIVEPFAGSKIDGVCMWTGDAPIVGLTLRFDRLDHFWFYLRHELEHVRRGDGRLEPVLDIEAHEDGEKQTGSATTTRTDPEAESQANSSAAAFCVPSEEFERFVDRAGPHFTDETVAAFAEHIGVHPALVAGQLRKRFGLYHMFRRHMVKVRSQLVGIASTDGYGVSPS